ncbi:N-formylglutamate amidohydrolase [Planctomicrobium piriforme]|uniref:Predicted N-formylglutamate amidohydrolase n=1 Tax=Planctomicrobium piriforme TaxID=1576369 RepID=A0A1I3SWV7_9PLAN|nr:N-formylglutamate amidohydrolase [Planctomicrobium piriforme]SFJ61797.1 Predicted N-formylglutamate amidohydrolase [Planctomicrobium piriforme]
MTRVKSATRQALTLVITCEHGGNEIPAAYRHCFHTASEALDSHRGYDPGALELAKRIAKTFQTPLHHETRSRLLIELNRSLHHKRLFSEFSRILPEPTRQKLIDGIYQPYRDKVTAQIAKGVKAGRVVHISVHSFTPVMRGKTRRTDIGLLFDPRRSLEKDVCRKWKLALQQSAPGLGIHYNLPYRGTSDGFTKVLREQFGEKKYAGIEIEVNQKYPLGEPGVWKHIQQLVISSLENVIDDMETIGQN